jgi:hypothetical protein
MLSTFRLSKPAAAVLKLYRWARLGHALTANAATQHRNGLKAHLINSVMPGNRTFPDEEDENNIPGLGAGDSTA